MNEEQWLSCDYPRAMLGFLLDNGRASERKLRLFAVACCRRVSNCPWAMMGFLQTPALALIEWAERYADGAATEDELDFVPAPD